MKIFMLLNTTAFLLLTPEQPTTLQFASPIEYYSLGNAASFDSYLTRDKKILLIRPKTQSFDAFLVVITKGHSRSYEFRLQSTPAKRTALYQIFPGKRERFYRHRHQGKGFRLLEGERSFKIERTKDAPLLINGVSVQDEILYYPKGASLQINGRAF